MPHPFVLHNETLCRAHDAVLSPGQLGLFTGWGVFSTLKVADGVPFAFERHWARMARDAAVLHVEMPEYADRLLERLRALVEANAAYDATMRLVVVRNGGGMWAASDPQRSSDVIALTADTKNWGTGERLTWSPQARHAQSRFAGTKSLSSAANLVLLEEARRDGFDGAILLNERGEVAECTSANLFVAEGGRVWTPPLASGCLPGVTRELLLEVLRVPGITVAEKTIYPADLEAAEEVFVSSTTRGLLPVTAIGDRAMPAGGAARVPLQKALTAYESEYVARRRVASTEHKSGIR